jgi:ribosome-binding factor A
LQSEVARRVNLKYASKLKFLADESFDEGSHIDQLLRSPKVARDLEGEGDEASESADDRSGLPG